MLFSLQSEMSESRQGRSSSTGDEEESLAILRRWVGCLSRDHCAALGQTRQARPTPISAFGEDGLNPNEPKLVENASLCPKATMWEPSWPPGVHTHTCIMECMRPFVMSASETKRNVGFP